MLRQFLSQSRRIHTSRAQLNKNEEISKVLWFDAKPGYSYVKPKSASSIVESLCENKIFENDELVAYNKPAGVRVYFPSKKHAGIAEDSQDLISIEDLLHVLAKACGYPNLNICSAPHPTYSGVTLMGKSDQACKVIDGTFRNAKQRNNFIRTDVAVTVGVPDPTSGVITVPIQARTEKENPRLVPVFRPSKTMLNEGVARKRRTMYNVLDSNRGASLVELKPRDGLSLQSLIHITCKLCPVLGDKLYSKCVLNVGGVKMFLDPASVTDHPPKLPFNLSKRLQIASSEHLERLPLHLHRYKITLPANPALKLDQETVIKAPIPEYFATALQLLNLKFPT